MAQSECLTKKIVHFVSLIDEDKNGEIEEIEMKEWCKRLDQIKNGNNAEELSRLIWTEFISKADLNNDGSISAQELVDYFKNGGNGVKESCRNVFLNIFKAIDNDGDGNVSQQELESFFGTFKTIDSKKQNEYAQKALHVIDEDKNGSISAEEFTNMGCEYFTENTSRSENFFGPIEQ